MAKTANEDQEVLDERAVGRRRILTLGAGVVGLGAAGATVLPGSPAGAADTNVDGEDADEATERDVIQLRRDNILAWIDENPTLAAGELGLVTGLNLLFAGDGTKDVSELRPAFGTGSVINVWDAGALGDDDNDDTDAIQSAIDTASAFGGGTVYMPPGTYRVESTSAIVLQLASKVRLVGAGRGATVIKSMSAKNVVGINGTSSVPITDVEVSNLTIDGNDQSLGAAVRGSWAERVVCKHLHTVNTGGYGIGFEAGKNVDVLIFDCVIEKSGADGVDFKDAEDGNARNRIDHVTVLEPHQNAPTESSAGIDIRGDGTAVSNCTVIIAKDPPTGEVTVGFRARFSAQGGPRTRFVNCEARFSSSSEQTRGFSIGADNCQLTNCLAEGAAIGFLTETGDYAQFANCVALDCYNQGFYIKDDHAHGIDCSSLTPNLTTTQASATEHFRLQGDDCIFQGGLVEGNSGSTSNGVRFVGTDNKWLNGKIFDVNDEVYGDGSNGNVVRTLWDAIPKPAVITQSDRSRTLALTDAWDYVRCTNALSTNVTVPPNSSVAFDIGTQVTVRAVGAGGVTSVAGSGVTVNAPPGGLTLAQGETGTLAKVATDEWDLIGP